jgi:HlyD family secretion protein
MRRAIWIGSVGLFLVVFSAWGFHTTDEVRVTTAAVTTGSITREVFATGTLQAVTTVEVGSQISGNVQSLEADYNSIVRQGQIIARLDPSTYEAQLSAANAALAQTRADVLRLQSASQDTTTKLARAQELFDQELIAPSDLDDARVAANEATADLRAAEAAIVQAQAAADAAAVDLSHTIIRSPIDGIVIERDVDVGQTLAASVQSPVLFRIAADLRRMQVNVDVDESDVDGLKPGEPVSFEVETYPGETFHGTLREMRLQPVDTQAAANTTAASSTTPGITGTPATSVAGSVVSYTTVIDVMNTDERLRPGMTAEVRLDGSHRDRVVRIPNAALSFRPPQQVLDALGEPNADSPAIRARDTDTRQVWRYDGTRLTPVAVHPGLADDNWTELIGGPVRPGDALATDAIVKPRRRI